MCVRVQIIPGSTLPQWRRHDVAISVPEGLTYGQALFAVRTILAELGAPQPQGGACCFCGAHVQVIGLTPVRRGAVAHVPQQRADNTLEVPRGA